MTTDDMIAMHKATLDVIESIDLARANGDPTEMLHTALTGLTAVATIQRDIIAEVLS
jgi:hypothetical protein